MNRMIQLFSENTEYWRQREDEARQRYIKDEKVYTDRVNSILDSLQDSINKEINGFYGKYAYLEDITLAEAKKRASEVDILAYERKARKYVEEKDFSEQANEELRLYNATMKINRLELLKANIGLEMVASYDEMQKYFDEILTDRTVEEFERMSGILGNTVQANAKAVSQIVNSSFGSATFSDRIWIYQGMMKNELSNLLTEGLIQGRGARQLATHLEKRFGVQKSDAERLMRTELARVQCGSQLESIEANGFDSFEWITEPVGACSICKAKDGKVFKIKDAEFSVNVPPAHPNCRCSIAAFMSRDDLEEVMK